MLNSYRQALDQPLLGLEEERRAILRWQQEQDGESLELLVRSHARQVWAMARRWTQNPSHLEDLVAEGVIGLIRAAENFDLSRDVRFSTYAAWWVRNELSGAMKRVRGSFAVINEEAARDWPPAEAEETAPADRMRPDAFYDLDSLPGDLPSPEEDAMRRSDEEMLSRQLRAALMELGPDEIEIVRRRRLVPQPEPVKALARDLGKTPERVRQIETRALQRLRQKLLAQGFNLSMLH